MSLVLVRLRLRLWGSGVSFCSTRRQGRFYVAFGVFSGLVFDLMLFIERLAQTVNLSAQL